MFAATPFATLPFATHPFTAPDPVVPIPEMIMLKVLMNLGGLASTTVNAFRGRVRRLQPGELPALLLYMGEDEILGDLSQGKMNSRLTLHVDHVVKTATAQVDTRLNASREEVTQVLLADHTQGLAFVLDTRELGADEPALNGGGEQPVGVMRTRWQIDYRRSRATLGA